MAAAYVYVDTSCLVAIAFGEPGARDLAAKLEGFDEIFSSNLLEAELRSAFAREEVQIDSGILTWIHWILPDRPLSPEITQVLTTGHVWGADLWHLACALYLTDAPRDLAFMTLDDRQRAVAGSLGFAN